MSGIRVTDKRMFTAEGELREEVRLELESSDPVGSRREAPAGASSPDRGGLLAQEPDRAGAEPSDFRPPPAGMPPLELPGTPAGLGAPTFYDLISVLAEPAALYLGDVPLPDGSRAENLDLARFHIDLLDLLRQRTAAALSVQERAVLEDVLYRLRLRYVQKRG